MSPSRRTADVPVASTAGRSSGRPTVGRPTALDPRHNSLNALRLVLAATVLVYHAWPLGGFGPGPSLGEWPIGYWAVSGFFAISGWLVTGSRMSTPLGSYLLRRVLRVYPGFAVCLLITAFAFAPLSSVLAGGEYRLSDGVRHVIANAALLMTDYSIGDTLSRLPYPGVWNGSLWSLVVEFGCYLLIGCLVSVLARRWLLPVTASLLGAITLAQVVADLLGYRPPFVLDTLAGMSAFFLAGAVGYLVRDRVPMRAGWALGAGVAWIAVLTLPLHPALAALPVAYLFSWLGATLPLQRIGRRNDLSYGIYIYAFPIQQLLVSTGWEPPNPAVFAVVGILATIPFAAASWFLVERPAKRAAARSPDRISRLRAR